MGKGRKAMYANYGWGAIAWAAFWGFIWIVLVGLVIWWAARWATSRGHPPFYASWNGFSQGASALEILRQRYARGEIDAATFEQMRERLEASYLSREAPFRDPSRGEPPITASG